MGGFKSRVALKTIRGEQTLAGFAPRLGVHQTMIAQWTHQASMNVAATFSYKQAPEATTRLAEAEKLHARSDKWLVEWKLPHVGFVLLNALVGDNQSI